MKLMIVDDEELTREGLIASVNWEKLGITEIYQADDGVNGLELAREVMPDIVICDVRMPRMDGIQMLERIQKINPDIATIFMSGFSDKEYLKAAIRLGAINYIEKPIETKELREAIVKAIEQNIISVARHDARMEMQAQTSQQLGNALTLPYKSNRKNIDKCAADFCRYFNLESLTFAVPIVVRIREKFDNTDTLRELMTEWNVYLSSMNLNAVFSEKYDSYLVIFVLGHRIPGTGTIRMVSDKLSELLSAHSDYQIVVGDIACGLPEIYGMYQNAVIRLQNAFFCKINCVLQMEESVKRDAALTAKNVKEAFRAYQEGISDGNQQSTESSLKMIRDEYEGSTVLPNQAKTTYYEILHAVYEESTRRHLSEMPYSHDSDSIMDTLDECFCLDEMHLQAVLWVREYFAMLGQESGGNATVRLIRDYIAGHFSNPDLSVKTISEFANMSTSYACTFFKNETGTTINQYITDYRMKRAKQLLADPRNRISEIAAMVGYSDGNYFGKNFKKLTGLTPSEYREQVIG